MKLTTVIRQPMVLLTAGLLAGTAFAAEKVVTTVSTNASCWQIQQALDALPATGGEVVLLPGMYAITQPLILKRSYQILRGSGAATILKLMAQANCPVIIMGEPVNNPARMVSNLRVADLTIDGNRREQQFEIWQTPEGNSEIRNNGITVQGVTDSVIENVTVAHCRSGGLVTACFVRRLTVENFTAFDSEFDGLACYRTEDSLFCDLSLHDNQAAGISMDLAVNNNEIRNAVLENNDLGIFMRYSRHNAFRDIEIRQSRKYGIFMAQAEESTNSGGWQLVANTECTNNLFSGLLVSRCGDAAMRVNNATCVDNHLTGARFADNPQGGISQVTPNLIMEETTVP